MSKIFTIKKLLAVVLSVFLILSLSACDKKDNKTDNDNSKPTQTEDVSDTSSENSSEESKENIDDTSSIVSEPDKTDNTSSEPQKPTPPPAPAKKTPAELVIGKWTATSDIAPVLIESGINVEAPLNITLNTEFTTSGTIIETVDKQQMHNILFVACKQAILEELTAQGKTQTDFEAEQGRTLDELINEYIAQYDNMFTFIAQYRFENETLLVKFDDNPFVETTYKFTDDDTLTITTDSEETTYTRVK